MTQILPDDVLWRIFNLNTPEDEDFTVDGLDVLAKDTSLLTARRTSQVCSKWRTLLLSSSSIWANALNLEELHNLSAEGRKEVWLRTASSPLSIYGVLVDDEEDQSFNEFFLAILEGHWSRIRRFAIPLGKHSNIVNDPRWSSIYLAAPTLEFFHLSNISDPHLPLAIGPLFSNCAPRLQSLALGNVSFDLRTPSFPRLRDIHLVLDSAFHPRFLWALNGMSNLENVNLTSTEDDDGALVLETEDLQDLPNLNLPKLRDLIVFSNLPFICALISRLTTLHPKANILMNATGYPVSVPQLECLRLLRTGFKRCYEKAVDSGAVDTMLLSPAVEKLAFRRGNEAVPDPSVGSLGFGMILIWPIWQLIIDYIAYRLEDVKELFLNPNTGPEELPRDYVNLLPILSSLSSLEVLHGYPNTLQFMTVFQTASRDKILFPRLRKFVFVNEKLHFPRKTKSTLKEVASFLHSRTKLGALILEIDATECGKSTAHAIQFLLDSQHELYEWNGENPDEFVDRILSQMPPSQYHEGFTADSIEGALFDIFMNALHPNPERNPEVPSILDVADLLAGHVHFCVQACVRACSLRVPCV